MYTKIHYLRTVSPVSPDTTLCIPFVFVFLRGTGIRRKRGVVYSRYRYYRDRRDYPGRGKPHGGYRDHRD